MEYVEPLHEVWGVAQSGGGVLTQFLDRWHPTNVGWTDPYDQSLTWASGYYALPGRWARSNSSFNRVNTDFLRLKSIELGYTLPKIKRLGNMTLRVYANAYNPLTFTKLSSAMPSCMQSTMDVRKRFAVVFVNPYFSVSTLAKSAMYIFPISLSLLS